MLWFLLFLQYFYCCCYFLVLVCQPIGTKCGIILFGWRVGKARHITEFPSWWTFGTMPDCNFLVVWPQLGMVWLASCGRWFWNRRNKRVHKRDVMIHLTLWNMRKKHSTIHSNFEEIHVFLEFSGIFVGFLLQNGRVKNTIHFWMGKNPRHLRHGRQQGPGDLSFSGKWCFFLGEDKNGWISLFLDDFKTSLYI